MVPAICKVPATVNVAPELIVMFLTAKLPEAILGILGTPEGISTSVVEEGTPAHQFPGVFQTEVPPSQVFAVTVIVPVAFTVPQPPVNAIE